MGSVVAPGLLSSLPQGRGIPTKGEIPGGQAGLPTRDPSLPDIPLAAAGAFSVFAGASEGLVPQALRPEDKLSSSMNSASSASLAGEVDDSSSLPSTFSGAPPDSLQTSLDPGTGKAATYGPPGRELGGAPGIPGKGLPGEYDPTQIKAPDVTLPDTSLLVSITKSV